MRRLLRFKLFLFLLAAGGLLLFNSPGSTAENETVVVIEISGTIDAGMASYVAYALEEAETLGAAAVILQFDTPGGFINAAESIRRLVDLYDGPVHAYVQPKAISAGAYLALAADSIYMVPGSTMGAAEPSILGLGEVDEKTLSFWEKEMADMAERRGRDPLIASAMVRRDIIIEDLVDEGNLLTLTSVEALRVGYSDGTVEDRAALLDALELSGSRWLVIEKRFIDGLVGWITNPLVGTVLLLLGLGGLALEIISPGLGVAGLVSIVAFTLYFGGSLAAGMAEYWMVMLFVLGIVLMLVEAFMPGLGVFGFTGLAASLAAIVMAAASVQTGMVMLMVSLALAGVFAFFSFRYFARHGALRHIILAEEERADLGYVAPPDRRSLTGLPGEAVTALRPSGTALIGGERVDVVSDGGFIPAGAPLVVDRVEGVRVIVRQSPHGD